MNKTVNINLGGIFFHIDEDAYQKLTRYFEAVKRSLTGNGGQDEIMNDIETRISEIFSERISSNNHVVVLQDVDAMIAIMGQPEDYQLEQDETSSQQTFQNQSKNRGKKLFRDMDNKILGGVSAGFAHYLGIDSLWIRLALVLIVIAGFGSPILVYILFWVLVPKATTTADKLAMTGEPANLFNIEKKVREELDSPDYDKKKEETSLNYSASNSRSIGSSLGEVLTLLFSIFGKIIGAFILLFSIPTLFALIVGLFATIFGVATFMGYPAWDYVNAVMYDGFPLWVVSILAFFAIGVPFFYFMVLGLKLLISNMKSLGNTFNYTLLALWIFSLAALVVFGAKQGKEYAYDNKVVEKTPLTINAQDTLMISFANNEFYYKDANRRSDFEIRENEQGQPIIYSNDIRFELMTSKDNSPYLIVEKEAKGSTLELSKKRAEKVSYGYKLVNNNLIFDNYLITDLKENYRGQEVKIFLYLPKGTIFKVDESVRNYDSTDNDFWDLWYDDENHTYQMQENDVKCLTCKINESWDENESVNNEDLDTINNISIKINDKEVLNAEPKNGRLIIDKNGIVKKQ
jgi:phage shock protein PspC (stress-responsive transcriptional regulator)